MGSRATWAWSTKRRTRLPGRCRLLTCVCLRSIIWRLQTTNIWSSDFTVTTHTPLEWPFQVTVVSLSSISFSRGVIPMANWSSFVAVVMLFRKPVAMATTRTTTTTTQFSDYNSANSQIAIWRSISGSIRNLRRAGDHLRARSRLLLLGYLLTVGGCASCYLELADKQHTTITTSSYDLDWER